MTQHPARVHSSPMDAGIATGCEGQKRGGIRQTACTKSLQDVAVVIHSVTGTAASLSFLLGIEKAIRS